MNAASEEADGWPHGRRSDSIMSPAESGRGGGSQIKASFGG